MIQLWQAALWLLLAVGTSLSNRHFVPLFDRGARSLRDSFPFSTEHVRQDTGNDIAGPTRDSKQVEI